MDEIRLSQIVPELKLTEDLVREGRHRLALQRLVTICDMRLPRHVLVQASALARRLGVPAMGLKMLHPYVRPSERKFSAPTVPERAEYAASLIRAGGRSEALQILQKIPGKVYPIGLLYRSFAFASGWNYPAVVGVLNEYLSLGLPDSYERLVVQVNLAQALVYLEELEQAETVLDRLILETKTSGANLLLANSLELRGHVFLLGKKWKLALKDLDGAKLLLIGEKTIDAFLIEKERALLELHRSRGKETKPLSRVRAEATRRGHWESVRDCDFNLAVALHDVKLAKQIYHGTPYEFYRARLKSKFADISTQGFVRRLGRGKESGSFDLANGIYSNSVEKLKIGQVPYRLFQLLSEDFYRPKNSIELFSGLFPTDHYHPRFSKDRFYQACLRLKTYLLKARLPLEIIERGGFYTLAALSGSAVTISYSAAQPATTRERLRTKESLSRLLRSKKVFQASEFATVLRVSGRTARRILKHAVDEGLVSKESSGPQSRYRIIREKK